MGGSLKPRRVLFWLHLAAGSVAGLFLASMTVTGFTLSLEPAVLAAVEKVPRVSPPAGARALDLDALAAKALAGAPVESATLSADTSIPVVFALAGGRSVFVDPYSGVALGEGARAARVFFKGVENIHRYFGLGRPKGLLVSGSSAGAMFLLALSGLVLWWPRRRTPAALRVATVPSLKGHGKARNWNWHNAVGFWTAPLLLTIATTGMIMDFSWANDLVYKVAGEAPPPRERGPRGDKGESAGVVALEPLAAAARVRDPEWRTIIIRTPRPGARETTVQIEEAGRPAFQRSALTLDASSARELKWEPVSGWSRGRRWRLFARYVHTGEAGGAPGRSLATFAAVGGFVLVWTGLSLAWRRLRAAIRPSFD